MNFNRTRWSWLMCGILSLACLAALATTHVEQELDILGPDDDTHVFMGRCPSGEVYRLFSYDKQVDGRKRSFYDYKGPAGQGTVKTQTAPRVIMTRVCLSLAEIADDE